MFCPKCRAEFRVDITECMDCGVKLVTGQPPLDATVPSIFDSDEVRLIESDDWFTIDNAKATLDAANIPYFCIGDISDNLAPPGGGYRGVNYIKIRKSDAAAAVAALREAGIGAKD